MLWSLDCWGLVDELLLAKTHGIELDDYRQIIPVGNDYPDKFYQDCWYECGFRSDGPPNPAI